MSRYYVNLREIRAAPVGSEVEDVLRLFDEKYRIFGIVNPIDLLVLLGSGCCCVRRIQGAVPAADGQHEATQERDIHGGRSAPEVLGHRFCQAWRHDLQAGGSPIGTVVSVESTPAAVEYVDPVQGPAVYASTTSQDVYIKVKAKGDPTNLGVVIGGVVLHNNTQLGVSTEFFEAADAFVTSMTVGP